MFVSKIAFCKSGHICSTYTIKNVISLIGGWLPLVMIYTHGVKICPPKRPLIAAIERVQSAGGPQLEFYRRDSEYFGIFSLILRFLNQFSVIPAAESREY